MTFCCQLFSEMRVAFHIFRHWHAVEGCIHLHVIIVIIPVFLKTPWVEVCLRWPCAREHKGTMNCLLWNRCCSCETQTESIAWKVKRGSDGKERRSSTPPSLYESWGVGSRARGRREWMTSSVGTEGYFKDMMGRRPLRTPLRWRLQMRSTLCTACQPDHVTRSDLCNQWLDYCMLTAEERPAVRAECEGKQKVEKWIKGRGGVKAAGEIIQPEYECKDQGWRTDRQRERWKAEEQQPRLN